MTPTKLMSSCLVPFLLLVLYCHHTSGVSYSEKCDVGLTSDNKQLDNCDKEKNLACQQGRCVCQDPGNQIWSARQVKVNSRTKRGSKSKGRGGGGIGKTILVGGAAGVAGGYLGGKLAQSGSSSGGGGGGGGGGGSNGGDGGSYKRREQYQSYYACHSRVGGQCVLDAYRDTVVIIDKPAETPAAATATTTTTIVIPVSVPVPVPAAGGTETAVSETTTSTTTTTVAPAPAPVAAAQVMTRMTVPKCVQYAECKTAEVKIVNGTVVSKVFDDHRVGSCTCKEGYHPNNLDICIKTVTNGSGLGAQISLFPIFVTVLVSLLYK